MGETLYAVAVYYKVGKEWEYDGYEVVFRNRNKAISYAALRNDANTYYYIDSMTETFAKAGGILNLIRE